MRTLVASILVAAALAAALIGWFGAGWSGVRQREAELRAEPRRAAEATARELGAEVVARLEELRLAEARRPYYHYQSLFHDPAIAAEGLAVAPSPLASGPSDPLVRGHFQLRPQGTGWSVTLPTINDDIPELNGVANFAADSELRRELVAVADHLVLAAAGPAIALPTVIASAEPRQLRPRNRVPQRGDPVGSGSGSVVGSGSGGPVGGQVAAVQDAVEVQTQVVELSPEQYAQNAYSNNAYQQALDNRRVIDPGELQQQQQQQRRVQTPAPRVQPQPRSQPDRVEPQAQGETPGAQPGETSPSPSPSRSPARKPVVVKPITIAVAPLEWHEATIGGESCLIALRRVDTPDGTLTQGLVIDHDAVAGWVADRVEGARLTSLAAADVASAAVPIGSWRVEIPIVDATASAVAAVRSAFWGRFIPIAALATLCGMMVIVVVARAERFARVRSRFAAAAAHELRTPLAGLQLYGDMLADGLGDPGKTQQYAHRISEEASRLGRVVANVLGFSQLERGDLAVHPEAGDAAAAARDVIERVRPALERASMTLEVELPDHLAARFDRDAVARILGNLFDNAEKYSRGTDPRRVSLRGRRIGDVVELAVTDTGPGVASGARLFVPFSRGVGADGPAGLGLGLALSRSLARAMGGDLVHTQGATFALTLPAASGSPAPAAAAA